MTDQQTEPASAEAAPRPGRGRLIGVIVVLGAVLVAVALVVFQPWKLFLDDVVDEALPEAGPATSAPPVAGAAESPTASSAPAPTAAPARVTLATGTFISHEHATSGTVRLLQLADGRRVLRIEGLDTSNGPDLKVWITDQKVVDGPAGWPVFDDGRYVDLGSLKGNKGSQNYVLPDDVRLEGLRSVSIWCDRFNVSFGAAELDGDL